MDIVAFVVEGAARCNVEFARPEHLRLLWLAVPLWLMSALAWRRTRTGGLVAALLVRTSVLLLVVLSLAGAGVKDYRESAGTVITAVDVSDSMGDEGRSWAQGRAREILETAGEGALKGVILFARGSEMKEPPSEKPGDAVFDYTLPTDATDIASAIRTASLAFPRVGAKRLAIISDGNETEGDSRAAAARAAHEGVRIDCLSPPEKEGAAAVVKRMDLPEEVNVSEKFTIRVVVRNRSGMEQRADLSLQDNGQLIKSWSVTLLPGTNAFEVSHRIVDPGAHRISAAVGGASGSRPSKGRASGLSATILVFDRPKVLCVSGTPDGKNFLAQVLEASDIDVRIGGVELVPREMDKLLDYDCVILANVPRSALTDDQLGLLERYVRDYGGGLIMLGGERSFGSGGYRGTAIERALPVTMEKSVPFAKDKIVRLSIVLVIDKSGSMGFGSGGKIIAARRAAEELVKQLKPNDRVGIIPFDTFPRELVALGPVGNRKAFIIDRIRTIYADGGTIISEPLEAALKQMLRAEGKVKHVILLTDGRTEDLRRYDYKRLIAAYRANGVSISTIGIGGDADSAFLKAVAKGTGGNYYYVKDASTLPIIVIQDTKKVLDKSDMLEETFRPKMENRSEMLKGIHGEQIPRLLGYMTTKIKKRAEMALYTDVRGFKDPILAGWRYGLGKAVAFTSDAEARWSKEMVGWGMFRKFWTQVLRWTMRRRSESRYSVRLVEGRGGRFLELESFTPPGEGGMFRIVAPAGEAGKAASIDLHQVAPYTYRGEATGLQPPPETVTVERVDGGRVLDRKEVPVIRRAPGASRSAETAATGSNEKLLEELASATGGRLNPALKAFKLEPERVQVPKSLLPRLMPLIFVLLLTDIALRKWLA